MKKIPKLLFCKKEKKFNRFTNFNKCLTCTKSAQSQEYSKNKFQKIQRRPEKLRLILEKIEKRRDELYVIWRNGLDYYVDFEYFVSLDGEIEGIWRETLGTLYKKADRLI